MVGLSMHRILALFALLSQVFGLVLHEQLTGVPPGWEVTGTPNASSELILQFALTLQNLDQLETKLASVPTPGSSDYGKYLDADKVSALFGASTEKQVSCRVMA